MTVDTQRACCIRPSGVRPAISTARSRGDDLFGNSGWPSTSNTGKMKCTSRAVHHDLWDMDLPPSPPLLDVTVNGKKTRFCADRQARVHVPAESRDATGFGVKETPVAQSQVPANTPRPRSDSGEASGAGAAQLQDGRSGHARTPRSHASLPRARRKERATVQCGPFILGCTERPVRRPLERYFSRAIGGTDWGGASTIPSSATFSSTLPITPASVD